MNKQVAITSEDFFITGEELAKRGSDINRKRKSRWQGAQDHFASSLSAIPKYLPEGLTWEQQEALAVRIRIEELTRKITIGDVDREYFKER